MFTADQLGALKTLVRIWTATRFVLIGASAMRLLLGDRSRETYDLDLILGVPLDRYPADLEAEAGWSRHPKREHTWVAPGDVYVDVLPVNADKGEPSVVTWPQSGFQMSVVGLQLALEHAMTIQAEPDLTIQVAPLALIALLKMVAFLDRPDERDRDLADIALILDEYIGPADDRRYEEEIFNLGLRYEEISPFLLGKRLTEIVNPPERKVIERFVSLVENADDSTAQARMLALAPPSWHRKPEELLLRLDAFDRGFRFDVAPH